MELERFIEIVDRQFAFFAEAADLDGHYLDIPPGRWKRRSTRRGWTRADTRRHIEHMAQTPPHLRDDPPGYRHPPTRVSTALRLFDLAGPVLDASRKAIGECDRHPRLLEIGPLVVRLTSIHAEWLDWLRSGEPSDSEQRWAAVRNEMGHLARAAGLLGQDHRRQEWDRWRELLTTEKRRSMLDAFWLARGPMSRAEISPESGSAFRRLLSELNTVAAKAKPPIPWTLRADTKTQKWAKHWFGR